MTRVGSLRGRGTEPASVKADPRNATVTVQEAMLEAMPATPMPAPPVPPMAGGPVERAPRTMTTLLVGKLLCGDGSANLCRIRNMSATGMLVETGCRFAVGDPIAVELRSGDQLEGTIAWTGTGRVGVQFVAPIAVETVLANARPRPSSTGPGVPRAPRFAVAGPARVTIEGRTLAVAVENVSLSGARIRMATPPARDTQLTLTIPGLPPRRCTTRWSDTETAGLSFLEAIPYHELADWLGHSGATH